MQDFLSVNDKWAFGMLRPMTEKAERGYRIRQARLRAALTQEQLAERLTSLKQSKKNRGGQVSRGAVGNWERGEGLTTENLHLLGELLKVDVAWLPTGESGLSDTGAGYRQKGAAPARPPSARPGKAPDRQP